MNQIAIVKRIIEKRGGIALEKARKEISCSQYDGGMVSTALKYFESTSLRNAMPVFSALISLSCDAVGGKSEETTDMGAALVLLTSAADIHDDIIDQSATKGPGKKTVYGKFGSEVALLAGDALLIQGLTLLNQACDQLSLEQKKLIQALIPQSVYEISKAEAEEMRLKNKSTIPTEEYLETIRWKAVAFDLSCQIGGIIANADKETVLALGGYGRFFGVMTTLRDDFLDLLEIPELMNRINYECPPLPMLYAMKNPDVRKEIRELIGKNITVKAARKISKMVLTSRNLEELKKELAMKVGKELELKFVHKKDVRKEMTYLLTALTDVVS